jgi:hypothetical protein
LAGVTSVSGVRWMDRRQHKTEADVRKRLEDMKNPMVRPDKAKI